LAPECVHFLGQHSEVLGFWTIFGYLQNPVKCRRDYFLERPVLQVLEHSYSPTALHYILIRFQELRQALGTARRPASLPRIIEKIMRTLDIGKIVITVVDTLRR
jgi:hypothetical protein